MANIIVTPAAIGKITEPEKIRVILYANNTMAHAPLSAILAPLEERIAFLEQQIGSPQIIKENK